MSRTLGTIAIAVGLAALAGCAMKQPAPPPVTATPRPQPPGGAAANLTIPPADGNGGYLTINDGLGQEEAIWHLRSALNVAALSCGGPANATLAPDYNALLAKRKAVFARAYSAETSRHRANAALDQHMTQLYNFFAQPPAQAAFCALARDIATQARAVPAAEFASFSVSALDRLGQPFEDFYRAYDGYRVQLAAWERGELPASLAPVSRAAPMALAASVPVASRGVAPASLWRIQLGAFSGQPAAETAWAKIRARMHGVDGFTPRYEPVAGKNLVRVQIGPVADRADSIRLCAAAAAAGFDCFPVVPS
ncbi:hypothetical protein ACFB49_02890 [Sphingomonas sp. DBB INV C78]|uniref:SPOR domain-containing protein n=1 Tax=Sphingomonas sp. DBB INV C78 TaxID=3349434 RepID=UPI0036D2DC80